MSLSTLTSIDLIPENSDATPGLWNRIFSQLSDNIGTMNSVAVPPAVLSSSTWAAINLVANSSTGSDYIRFQDSSGAKSNYRLGSFAGGTADGLNIYDESGQTMIASFSKQSIRFFQQVVGPVFDIGGALSDTLNAATFGTGSDSDESRIQSAIVAAANQGISRVYVPASMLPYSASSMSFIYSVQMIREGGSADEFDVKAYGAAGDGIRSDTSAIQEAISTLTRGGICKLPLGTFKITSTITISNGGVAVIGSGSHLSGTVGFKPTSVDASSLITGANAFTIVGGSPTNTMKGNKLKAFYLEMLPTGGNGGAGIAILNGSLADIDLDAYCPRGATSYCLKLGDTSTAANAVIASRVNGAYVTDGTPILVGKGCTAVELKAYTLGASTGGIVFNGATYCVASACASDTGTATGYGYSVNGATGITFNGCGAENNGMAFIEITGGSTSIILNSCRGVGNNTSANSRLGSFVQVGGGTNYNITIIDGVDSAADPATTSNLSFGANTSGVNIIGWNATVYPSGMSGNATVIEQHVSTFAGNEQTGWSLNFANSSATTGEIRSFLSASQVSTSAATVRGQMILGNMIAGFTANQKAYIAGTAASGALVAGAYISSVGGLNLNPDINGTAGAKCVTSYWNGSAYKSAVSVANVASGNGQLDLMSDGGTVNITAARTSIRTLAASSLTLSAGNTNVQANEFGFTVGGPSGASIYIHSGGTVYVFNSALSAKAT